MCIYQYFWSLINLSDSQFFEIVQPGDSGESLKMSWITSLIPTLQSVVVALRCPCCVA